MEQEYTETLGSWSVVGPLLECSSGKKPTEDIPEPTEVIYELIHVIPQPTEIINETIYVFLWLDYVFP